MLFASAMSLIESHTPADADEAEHLAQIRGALALGPGLTQKHHWDPGHLTSSALVLSPDERALLLIFHRGFGRWIQPGGHLDPTDPEVHAAARRELAEETGLTQVRVPAWAPGLLDVAVHRVPGGLKPGQPAHLHFDLRVALVAQRRRVNAATDAADVGWFALDGLDRVETDGSVRLAARRMLERRGAAR